MNKKVVLCGNPNVGKSTIFNSLTGLRQHTGNWTGKTVDIATGIFKHKNEKSYLCDLPGTYSLHSASPDEEAARDFIINCKADLTIVVVDATCLERNLILTQQIMEITSNILVCVNLMDEARRNGIHIDLHKLSSLLKVPVIGISANRRSSIRVLKDEIHRLLYCSVLNTPPLHTEKKSVADLVYSAENIGAQVVSWQNSNPLPLSLKVDKIVTSKVWGLPIMLSFLGLIFWLTIILANYPSEKLAEFFAVMEPYAENFLTWVGLPDPFVRLLVDGVYVTLTWVVSVMLPPMAIFFPLFSLFEDLGFLPRIAFNLDGCFEKSCACGKQALTMCMGNLCYWRALKIGYTTKITHIHVFLRRK